MAEKAGTNFDCDENIIQDIENCIRNYLNEPEKTFTLTKIINEHDGSELMGYIGEYQRLKIEFSVNGDNENIHLFIKTLPKDEERAKKLETYGFFYRECNIFSEIFPQFTKRTDDDTFLPKCLLVKKNELFLENLSAKGFKNTSNRESFDEDHCYVALSQIAKFHAESIILEESKSNGYKIIDEYKHCLNQEGYRYEGWYSAGMEAGLEAAKSSPKIPNNIDIASFENEWRKLFKNVLKLYDESEKVRNVLCHRDLWGNNIMFRYTEDGKPIQCIFIDFQISGYMPPSADVMILIYLNIMDKRRHDNLEDYLQYYYKILTKELMMKNINVNNVVPWNEFRDTCEEHKKVALTQCVILHQLTLVDSKCFKKLFHDPETSVYVTEVSRSHIILDLIKTDSVYKEKFMFSVDEITELCLQNIIS